MADRDEAERRTANLFDALATEYDASGVDFFQPIAIGLVAALEPRPGENWLDMGCGRGAVTFPLAAAVDPGRVVGLDAAPGMVELAATTAAERGVTNVDFVLGSAQTPHPSLGQVDGIASSLVLFFLPDALEAVSEWRALLRPGGRVGITTFGATDARWRDVDAVLAPYLPRRDARTSGSEGPFGSDAGMEHLLERAGFTGMRTVSQAVEVVFSDVDQWQAFSMSTGQRAAWLAVPESDREAVRDEARMRLRSHARPDGSIAFEQVVRHTIAQRPQ
jgi:ubiquinone/menaquinone biosynthesis C-methylase UbiE